MDVFSAADKWMRKVEFLEKENEELKKENERLREKNNKLIEMLGDKFESDEL